MAYIKTNDTNYSNIANAIRGLHKGTTKYTPAQMVTFLSTQGAGLQPCNVRKGVTIFGVTGTLSPTKEE